MSYFLSDQELKIGALSVLEGQEARHLLLSRRIREGETVVLQGRGEKRFHCEVVECRKGSLTVRPLAEVIPPNEPEIRIAVAQSFINEQALDFVLQKGTELGAFKIILFNSANSARKLTQEDFNKKSVRWNKILLEAAKQCDRIRPPRLEFAANVESVLRGFQKVVLLDPQGGSFKDLNMASYEDCSLVIGPEGGFIPQEIDFFNSLPNCSCVSLGPILLRAETAALAALAAARCAAGK